MTEPRPVWLLDFDGVVNAITRTPDGNVWPRAAWSESKATSAGTTWPVWTAGPVVEFIAAVHAAGRAEIRWHTSWQEAAPGIGAGLGLPEFPVAAAPEFDPNSGTWKIGAAERVLLVEGRSLIWTDDDLSYLLPKWRPGGKFSSPPPVRYVRSEFVALGRVLLVEPSDMTGLCRRHLRAIESFLADSDG